MEAVCGVVAAGAGLEAIAVGVVVDAFCLAIAPVIDSSPCSSTVTREESRSRSLPSVSTVEVSLRISFWLSRASSWICCA